MQRRRAVIFLLTIYSARAVLPMLPYIGYALNYDYISKVLCINKDKPQMHCNGKCHLSSQLKKSAARDEKPSDSHTTISWVNLPQLVLDQSSWTCKIQFSTDQIIPALFKNQFIGLSAKAPPTPPPRA